MSGYIMNRLTQQLIEQINNAKIENGFMDREDSTISFTNGTRTFTIQPTGGQFQFKSGESLFTKVAAESIVIPDVSGLYFLYFDTSGTLVQTTTFITDIIQTFALACVVYWDAVDSQSIIVADERHGAKMSGETHAYLHRTRGASLGTRGDSGVGFKPGGITVDASGDLDAHCQCSVTDGEIWDEDLNFSFTDGSPQDLSPVLQAPFLYRSGASGQFRKVAASGLISTTAGTGRAAWNEDTGSTWQLTEAVNNDFVVMHLFATTDISHPLVWIVGQGDYATVGQARTGAETEIRNLVFGDLLALTAEFSAIASFIIQTSDNYSNAAKSRVRTTDNGDDYLDWRLQKITAELEEA